MTDTTNQADKLTVTQADRERAADALAHTPAAAEAYRSGRYDHLRVVQAFAAHRLAHSGEGRSNRVEVRDEIHDALVRAYSQGANDVHAEWQKHWESGDGYGPPDPDFTESSHDHAASEMPGLGAAIAALTPQGDGEIDGLLNRFIFEWFNERDPREMQACLEEYDARAALSNQEPKP